MESGRPFTNVQTADRATAASRVLAIVEAMRPHQWAKNLLVFVPLLASHRLLELHLLLHALAAFAALSFAASAGYIANDLWDRESDRRHPRKRNRPFASGRARVADGLLALPLMAAAAIGIALTQPREFGIALAGYFVGTTLYSWRLKREPMLDVIVLAGLFTLRVIAGGYAVAIPASFWLLAFSMFVFLSLALVKRYTELLVLKSRGGEQIHGRGYVVDDLTLLQSLGVASAVAAVMVIAFYVNSPAIVPLYTHPHRIWLLCPVALYAFLHIWMQASRGKVDDDPLLFAMKDRICQLSAAAWVLIVLMAL